MHFLLPQPVWSSFSTFNSKRLPACIFELFYAFENCVLVQLTKKKKITHRNGCEEKFLT